VDGLEIDNFKAQVAEGVTPARFEAVKRLVIRNSPLLLKSDAPTTEPAAKLGSPAAAGRYAIRFVPVKP
jgi:hypothetical protein